MKVESLIGYLLFLMCIASCAKSVCPEPEAIITTSSPAKNEKNIITLQPGSEGKDAMMNMTDPSQNFSDKPYLHCRAWTVNGVLNLEKGIVQFDYSAIPAGAVINKAILIFFADTTVNTGSIGHSNLSGPNDWSLKRVTQAWNENTVTWNTQPTTDLDNVIQCAASTSPSQTYVIDVTSWVADEIAHPASYYGFLMQINNEKPYRALNFYSSDCPYPTLRPKMIIQYSK